MNETKWLLDFTFLLWQVWDLAPCNLVEVDVSEACTASIMAMMMEAVCASETSVYFNETTQCYIPECCNLQNGCAHLVSMRN
jgi:hypothetical protein